MKQPIIAGLTLTCLLAHASIAADSPPGNPYRQRLQSVPSAELPGLAATLVKQTKPSDAAKTAVDVTKAAVALNPAAAPAIVGAIAHSAPDTAAVSAETAAAQENKQAAAVAKAAVAAAPSRAGLIVAGVCRAVPKSYRAIAVAASQAAPGSSREILKAVASVVPDLRSGLEEILASASSGSISVAAALDRAKVGQEGTTAAVTPPPQGPAVGPPFVPLSGTVKNVAPDTSGEVPAGGRNYARP